MKVSKVEHTRTAVCQREGSNLNQNMGGTMYRTPANPQYARIENLQGHIRELNKRNQNLYNVINPNMEKVDKTAKYAINSFNKIMKWLLKKNHMKEKSPVDTQLYALANFTEQVIVKSKWDKKKRCQVPEKKGENFYIRLPQGMTYDDLRQLIHDIVAQNLRSSLRKYAIDEETREMVYLPDVIEQLMYATCLGRKFLSEYKKISEKNLSLMLNVLNADYTKEKQIKQLAESIDKQNVKVQPDAEGTLRLSSASHVNEKKDYKSKKYIADFAEAYACLEKEERDEKLCHMRQLIVLYFYGADFYKDDSLKITADSFGKLVRWKETFSEEVQRLAEERRNCAKGEKKNKLAQIQKVLRSIFVERFSSIVTNRELDITNEDRFWLNWIAGETERLLNKQIRKNSPQLDIPYLCRRIFENWTSFIAMKYVDLGKAVYHFTVPELTNVNDGEIDLVIGDLLPEYKSGFTSFDYERITAEERLERGLTTYLTFAINNFAQAIASEEVRSQEGYEDVLFPKDGKQLLDATYTDSVRRILQYFGGQSKWNDATISVKENTKIIEYDHKEMIVAFQDSLSLVRNPSFHYTTKEEVGEGQEKDIIRWLYEEEVRGLGNLYSEKFFSNNTLLFYSSEDVSELMKNLYEGKNNIVRKMPSFKNVISRNDMLGIVERIIDQNAYSRMSSHSDLETLNILKATLYFVLEEIYYHDFVGRPDCLQLFRTQLERMKKTDKKHGCEIENFWKRVKEICDNDNSCTMEKLSEMIMTDYNMQNSEKKRLASKEVKTQKDKTIYKHFPHLLRMCLKEALLDYVGNEEWYRFIKKPEVRQISEQRKEKFYEMNQSMEVAMYKELDREIRKDRRVLAWYATAHFLSPKYLNQLNGTILSYLQTIQDIEDRAKTLGSTSKDNEKEVRYYRNVVTMLNLVRNYAGKVSHDFTDYFCGDEEYAKEEYAKILSQYVSSEILDNAKDRVGIYYDGKNPILNRNIIMTLLYGNVKAVTQSVKKIKESDIRLYHAKESELAEVLKSGLCQDGKQQKEYKAYQNQKNRVELLDTKIFAEIVNDLYAKLISWAYLRERDLMYFQLGVHYIRLKKNFGITTGDYKDEISSEGIHITRGGILYQIIAMYTCRLPFLKTEKDGERVVVSKRKGSAAIRDFLSLYPGMYDIALELFERLNEHEEIIHTRNYFDHFKYYVNADQSIMDMYNEIYNRFFTYDLKLRKSVSYILEDILKSYFVIPYFEVVKGKGLTIKDMESDQFTYKQYGVKVDARTSGFMEQVKKILEYKKNEGGDSK